MQAKLRGGEIKVVQIDEAKFGKRKYGRGKIVEGQWVFGGIDTKIKEAFLVSVVDESSKTLTEINLKWTKQGTTIVSDCWVGFKALKKKSISYRSR